MASVTAPWSQFSRQPLGCRCLGIAAAASARRAVRPSVPGSRPAIAWRPTVREGFGGRARRVVIGNGSAIMRRVIGVTSAPGITVTGRGTTERVIGRMRRILVIHHAGSAQVGIVRHALLIAAGASRTVRVSRAGVVARTRWIRQVLSPVPRRLGLIALRAGQERCGPGVTRRSGLTRWHGPIRQHRLTRRPSLVARPGGVLPGPRRTLLRRGLILPGPGQVLRQVTVPAGRFAVPA